MNVQEAIEQACGVSGCGKPVYCKGYCGAHYTRLRRHGDPLGGGITPGTTAQWIRDVAVSFEGDDCLIWPFGGAGGGYGRTWADDRPLLAHRVVCELAHGVPPTPLHEAAHECGRGHMGCVNPKHLRWATPKENQQDRTIHNTDNRGTRAYRAKLTEADVRGIRAAALTMSTREIADRYGITKVNVRFIVTRKTWGWLDDAR